jgi:hypothetical protein
MIDPGFGASLVVGMLLFSGGFLAAALRMSGGRRAVAVVAMLAGALVSLVAMVRHRVLDDAGLGLALVVLVGGLLLLSAPRGDQDGGQP